MSKPFEDDGLVWSKTSDNKRMVAFEKKHGHVLTKACCDDFQYALKLRTGEVILFDSAEPSGEDFLHLHLSDDANPLSHHKVKQQWPHGITAERGMDVRISDIVWAMDAPWGS